MDILTLGIARTKSADGDFVTHLPSSRQSGGWWGSGWFSAIREGIAGAWQRSLRYGTADIVAHSTVWACVTLIASDISKLALCLVEYDDDGLSEEVVGASPFRTVLQKPNHFQTRITFFYCWILSKLLRGNAYILKERDARGMVVALYVLDPSRVQPMVSPDGQVFYQLGTDNLAGLQEPVTVPAREIIHDIMVPLYHPLVGVSPIHACGLAAFQALTIQQNSARMFQNGAQLQGVLTAPGSISPQVAERLEKHWQENYAGERNIGKVAVLGDGLKFESMTMTAIDAQMIDQLKWSDEKICSTYHVPPYMVGVGAMPNYNNIEALNQQYYSQCLQALIEAIELLLDEGNGIADYGYNVEFDLEGLLRLDTATRMKFASDGVKGSIFTPNEGRRLFNKRKLKGGDTVYMQQQNYSLAALDARDSANPAPSSTPSPADPAAKPDSNANPNGDGDETDDSNTNERAFGDALIAKMADVDWTELDEAA